MNTLTAPHTLWNRLLDCVVQHRLALLFVAIFVTAVAIVPANRVTFDQSIESLYTPGNPKLVDYVESKATFGGDEFVFVVYTDPELFKAAGQERLTRLTARVTDVPGVVGTSVQSLPVYLTFTAGPFQSLRQRLLTFTRGILLGDDNETTAVMLRLADEVHAPVARAATIAELRQIAAEQPIPTYVVGEPILVHDMFRYSQDDGEIMGFAAAALLGAFIVIFLRSIRAVALPFAIVYITIVWTKAALWLSGLQLSMVSSILASLLTIIGVSTVAYLLFVFQELCERHDRPTAFRRLLHRLAADIVWVCIATAVGFSAQLTSHLHPVRSFGLTMVIGSLLVLVVMALVLPGGMLLGSRGGFPMKPRGHQQIKESLHGLNAWVLEHPRWIAVGAIVWLLVSVAGLFRLRLETDFSRNFRATTPTVQALDVMEDRLGGAGTWEVNFAASEEIDEKYLARVRQLADRLRGLKIDDQPALTKVVALTDGLDLVPRIPFIVPDAKTQARLLDTLAPEFRSSLYNGPAGRMRIMLRARERQSAEEKARLFARVLETAKAEFPEAKVTGLFVLLASLLESLIHDQWIDVTVAAIGLIAVMTLAYRSMYLGFISLVPNVLPIVFLLGGMGWAGIPINIGTAMIASDAMGLTIHDSIFYLSAYRRARQL